MQKLVYSALSLMLAICGGAVSVAAAPAENSYVASLRRLTEQEYRNSIADIFGKEIEVRGSFEPTIRSGGLAATGGTVVLRVVGGEGADSGLDDSVTGQNIVLVVNGNVAEGHVGHAAGPAWSQARAR